MKEQEIEETKADDKISFRLPKKHKKLIEIKAKKQFDSVGDVMREIVREWVREQESPF